MPGEMNVDTFPQMMRRWLSQDVARLNAAQASGRLSARRRDRESVEVYLAKALSPPSPAAVEGRDTSFKPPVPAPAREPAPAQ